MNTSSAIHRHHSGRTPREAARRRWNSLFRLSSYHRHDERDVYMHMPKSQEEGKVVISHPLGKQFVSRLKAVDDTVVPHDLPDRDELEKLTQVNDFIVAAFAFHTVVLLPAWWLLAFRVEDQSGLVVTRVSWCRVIQKLAVHASLPAADLVHAVAWTRTTSDS